MNWQAEAARVIGDVHKTLPADADLKTRKKALNEARPHEFRVTSWGRKVWAKHARNYLEKFGLEPLTVKRGNRLPLSPLERMMQRAKARENSSVASSQALTTDEDAVTLPSRASRHPLLSDQRRDEVNSRSNPIHETRRASTMSRSFTSRVRLQFARFFDGQRMPRAARGFIINRMMARKHIATFFGIRALFSRFLSLSCFAEHAPAQRADLYPVLINGARIAVHVRRFNHEPSVTSAFRRRPSFDVLKRRVKGFGNVRKSFGEIRNVSFGC